MKEAARQRRLRELEERRFAWAATSGGQSNNGGFGRSSSENDVDILTKEGLLDFLLQPRPNSPHNPMGRSASARRYRHTTADRSLRGYLELFSGSPTADSAKFSSLPRSGRNHQRRTMPWLASQDDNRELEAPNQLYHDKLATSPKAETEPISPLARYSMSGYTLENDAFNNNNYSSVSEGILPHPRNVFQKPQGQSVGQMHLSVERHTLVPGLQPFELTNSNNNSSYMPLDNQGNIFVTDLEERKLPKSFGLETPPSSKSSEEAQPPKIQTRTSGPANDSKMTSPQREEEEDTSTVSSTTCDTPLPLDPSLPNKKCIPYILDCTETDCSVMLDCSEIESSPILKEGSRLDVKPQESNFRSLLRDPSSLSSNFESLSTNDPSGSASADDPVEGKAAEERPRSVTPSVTTDEADTDSCDTAEGKKVGEKAVQTCSTKPTHSKTKSQSKPAATRIGRPARTLTATETQSLRKVVPITKLIRTASNVKRGEKSLGHCAQETAEPRRPLRDQSTPARRGERQGRPVRHSSLPPEQAKAQRGTTPSAVGSRWARDLTPHKPSFKKPNAKPVRNIPKPPPEEKMCRSTMRALAQAQAASEGGSPQTPTHASKASSALPSFARNTVSSSSRTKKDLSIQPVPGTPSKTSTLSRSGPQKAPSGGKSDSVYSGHSVRGEDKPAGSLRRVQSVRAPSRSTQRSDTPPPHTGREQSRKGSSFSEKSFPISSRILKPMWK